jgi:hypothetical protein
MPKYLKYEILYKFNLLTFAGQAPKPAGYSKMSEIRAKGVSASANRPGMEVKRGVKRLQKNSAMADGHHFKNPKYGVRPVHGSSR